MKKEIILNLGKILAVGYIMFISLFALDEWGNWQALFMHLIPSFVLIAVLILAWKKQLIGGLLFLVASASTIFYFHTYKQANIFALISLPPIIIGLLFIAYSYKEK